MRVVSCEIKDNVQCQILNISFAIPMPVCAQNAKKKIVSELMWAIREMSKSQNLYRW